jgi:hypothetical protein
VLVIFKTGSHYTGIAAQALELRRSIAENARCTRLCRSRFALLTFVVELLSKHSSAQTQLKKSFKHC